MTPAFSIKSGRQPEDSMLQMSVSNRGDLDICAEGGLIHHSRWTRWWHRGASLLVS